MKKELAEAGKEWIPDVFIVGEQEIKAGKIIVNRRSDNSKEALSIEDRQKDIKEKSNGMPFRRLPVPRW